MLNSKDYEIKYFLTATMVKKNCVYSNYLLGHTCAIKSNCGTRINCWKGLFIFIV